jgi:cytochrome c oxidase assembly protein subunit 15
MSLATAAANATRDTDLAAQSGLATRDRAVGVWLLVCCAMVFGMVLLGGITRLTGSGLSIMEWKPIMGAIPPLTTSEWNRVFALYQQIAEYKHVNAGMTLEEFQGIFWWEYLHRLWGRTIGVAFLLPFVWFLAKGYLRRPFVPRLAAMFALGALQGFVGWFMVASGFEDRVDVSQYRLVLHLALALFIYAFMFWSALDLLQPARLAGSGAKEMSRHCILMLGLIALEICLGGLVAGLHGGLIDNNFPMMGDHFIATGMFAREPWWSNFTENPETAQFLHRLCAGVVAVALISLVVRARNRALPRDVKFRVYALPFALAGQAVLGIATLMLMVPVPLAVAHQAGAIVLLSFSLFALHGLKRVDAPAA